MTPRDRDYVVGVCASLAGLNVETERSYLLESGLGALARREGYGSTAELVRAVRDRGEERLVWAIVESLAPAQAAFFRDPEVFDAIAGELEASAGRGAVRVWSAGCGAGQEAYSLAILLEERGVDGVEMFASDISERRLEKARSGLFTQFEVQQGLSARRLVRHFANLDDAFLIDPELRQEVQWRRSNLLEASAELAGLDLILCRYVLPALLPSARHRAVANLVAALRPGGRLVLGARETLPLSSGLAPVPGVPGMFEAPAGIRAAA